jgi:predicted acetyltransferase
MTDPYPIRPITEAGFDAFRRVDEHAFNDQPLSAERRARTLRLLEFDRTLAAFDGADPVGIAGAYTFQLSVPGAVVPAAGVTWVAVLPTHRRRGILRSIMRRQLTDVAAGGEPIAALWASEAVLYGRYGYGKAAWAAAFTVHRGEGELSSDAPRDPALRLRLVSPDDALPALAKVFDTVLQSRPGLFARDDNWWARRIADLESERAGRTPLHCLLAEDDSGPRGYALYSGLGRWDDSTFLPDGSLEVRELVAADPAAGAAMWENLLSRDLVTSVTAELRPADDPLLFQLLDPRRLRARVADSLWIRLVDLPGAMRARRYSAAADVVLEVRDSLLPANEGRWRLTTPGPTGSAGSSAVQCARTSDMPDISLDVRELGAAYLGGTSLGSLATAGLVTEHRAGAVAALSAALAWTPSPWCPMIF